MLKTCENCKKHGNCTSLCAEIEALLEPPPSKSVSTTNTEKGTIDSVRKIDRGRSFSDATDNKIDWDVGPEYSPQGLSMDQKDYENFKEYVKWCDNKSRRKKAYLFFAFIRCDKEYIIAERANVTPQNIQKYLMRIIKCVIEKTNYKNSIAKKDVDNLRLTPVQFKKKYIYQSPKEIVG
jgi:hypothetical protein